MQYQISSKKAAANFTGAKLVTMILVLIVLLIVAIFMGVQTPVGKEMVLSMTSNSLAKLNDAESGSQGASNIAEKEIARLKDGAKETSNTINLFKDSNNCIIKISDLISSFDESDSKIMDDFSFSFILKSGEVFFQMARKSLGDSGTQSFELNGIEGVNIIRDAEGIAYGENIPATQIIGLLSTIDSSLDDGLNKGFNSYETIVKKEGASSRYALNKIPLSSEDELIIIEEGEFSDSLGYQEYLLKEYMFKFDNKLFFYNGDMDGTFGKFSAKNVHPDDIKNTITSNMLCDKNEIK